MMLNGTKSNIRAILKSGSIEQQKTLSVDLGKAMRYLAKHYTGAKLDGDKLTQEQAQMIAECVRFVIDMFPMLSLEEIYLAFKMAAAKKLDVSLKAYYGIFNNEILGSVLSTYLRQRNAVLSEYNKHNAKELKQEQEEKDKVKNIDTHNHVISQYNKVKKNYQENGDIEELESSVYPYWGKILVSKGIIDFTREEKRQIVQEAKDLVEREIKSELAKEMHPTHVRELKHLLVQIQSGFPCAKFDLKWRNKYAKLIVIKSIIK
jgi:uncharacterized protein YqeY